MLPAIVSSICWSLGLGVVARSPAACMIWPLWQYPHWGDGQAAPRRDHALADRRGPDALDGRESSLPSAAEIGVTHERVGRPSRCTVHAPHSAMPQPNFVPVSPSSSRSVHSSAVSPGDRRSPSFR